jgi:hypothetical protein
MSKMEALEYITPDRVALATVALEQLGWDLLSCEIDLSHETFRLELGRDALRVTLDARNGRVMLEREIVRLARPSNVRHTHGLSWERVLLGRRRPEGVRSGLLLLANYIQDNGAARLEARAAVALLLG